MPCLDNIAMATFDSGGLTIAFDDIGAPGEGRPVILVHGFTSNRNENWRRLGWYGAFERRRMRMIALDCRGHGESAKPHDPDAYGRENMAGDILALMDHLGIERAHLLGFSMGSRLALAAALKMPKRFSTLTIGGVGEKLFEKRDIHRQSHGRGDGSRRSAIDQRADAAEAFVNSPTNKAKIASRSPH